MDSAQVIRDARRGAGLTQAGLAKRGGTSQATISAYENGAKEPALSTFGRLLRATGMKLTTVPGPVVLVPTDAQFEERGRILAQVLALAGKLPHKPASRLRYPRLARGLDR